MGQSYLPPRLALTRTVRQAGNLIDNGAGRTRDMLRSTAAMAVVTALFATPAWPQTDDDAINLICTGRGERLASGYTNTLE